MAYTSKTLLLFVLVAFLLFQVFAAEAFADHGNEFDDVGGVANLAKVHRHPKINCSYACARRCKKSSRKNVCRRACGTCCFRCQCVPPGTYGNKNSCPCYAKLTTHGKRPKCP